MINVALPADLEKRVNETVERGEYASREKFFEEAAELLLGLRNGDGIPVPAGGAHIVFHICDPARSGALCAPGL